MKIFSESIYMYNFMYVRSCYTCFLNICVLSSTKGRKVADLLKSIYVQKLHHFVQIIPQIFTEHSVLAKIALHRVNTIASYWKGRVSISYFFVKASGCLYKLSWILWRGTLTKISKPRFTKGHQILIARVFRNILCISKEDCQLKFCWSQIVSF